MGQLSAKAWSQTPNGGFDITHIRLPEGVKAFEPSGLQHQIAVIPHIAGVGNKRAAPGSLWYENTYWVHRNIGPNESMYVCNAKTYGERCPVCDYAKQASNPDPEYLKTIVAKERQLWNIYDFLANDKGVQVWDVSFHLFGKQLKNRIASGFPWYEWFADPEDGSKLYVGFAEKTFGSGTYYETVSIDFEKRGIVPPHLLNAATVLENVPIKMDYDALRDIFLMGGAPTDAAQSTRPATSAGGWAPEQAAPAAQQAGGWAPAAQQQQAPQGGGSWAPQAPAAAAAEVNQWAAAPAAPAVQQQAPPPAAAAQAAPFDAAPAPAPAAAAGPAAAPKKGQVITYPGHGQVTLLKDAGNGTCTFIDANDDVHKNQPWPPGAQAAPTAAPAPQQQAPAPAPQQQAPAAAPQPTAGTAAPDTGAWDNWGPGGGAGAAAPANKW